MKKNNILFWILGFIFPIVGIILFFIFKNKDKSKSNSAIKGSIVSFCIAGIIVLFIATHPEEKTVDDWYNDVSSGNTVLTVIGASFCNHCQEYKPVIKKIAKKNNIDLYFFEIDMLSESDQDKLTNSFKLDGYDGSVPYTFIMKNGTFVAQNTGYQYESLITTFLFENGLIKD